ncbi:hypothetical protein C6P41_002614, partial [Kluyveromyces marxianus]
HSKSVYSFDKDFGFIEEKANLTQEVKEDCYISVLHLKEDLNGTEPSNRDQEEC